MPRISCLAIVFLVSANIALSQPKGTAPAIPANYPTLTTPAHLGTAPGSTLETVLTGTNLLNATAIVASFPCQVTIVEPTKDPTKLKVKFEIPKTTPIGLYFFRVATEAGPSNLRPFIVDALPLLEEKEGNTKKDTPQSVPVPCVITGTAVAETGDYYKFKVSAGQTLTLEALGRRMGSPLDPVLILYDAKANELPGLWADDTPGLQTDARVTHTFPSAGEYIVEIRDTTYRGGADYAYRLRIGEYAGPTSAFPLAIERGKKTEVGFAGPKGDSLAKQSLTADAKTEVVYAIPPGPQPGWPVPVRVSENPESVELEPNNTQDKANLLPVPGGVSAKFATKGDVDWFKFAGKKGQKVVVQALSYELNLPTEIYVRLLDAQGKELVKSNPQTAGVRLEYLPAADGEVFIVCEQNNYAFGPNEIYHLSVKPASPDFSVVLGLDRFDIPTGGVALVPVTAVNRINGFAGPIELSYGASKITIPAAAAPTPVAPFWFPITMPKDAKPGVSFAPFTAKATIDGKDVVRSASTQDIVKASLANLPNPPLEFASAVAVATVPASALKLELVLDKTETAKGGTLKGKVKATRTPEIDGEIAISSVVLANGATAKLNPIAKGKTEADVEFTFPNAGTGWIVLKGTTKVKGKDVAGVLTPIEVKVTEPPKKEEPKKK